jgi:hypothetical protein
MDRKYCCSCGNLLGKRSKKYCDDCYELFLDKNRSPYKPIIPKPKPKESVDDIARKARKHGLSYGKYLEERGRGKYLDEVDE